MLDLDKSVLSSREKKLMYEFIQKKSHPVPETKLGQRLVTNRLRDLSKTTLQRVYSPEQKYSEGEKLLFCFDNMKIIPALILKIEKSHSKYGPYENISVAMNGHDETKQFVTDCPRFPRKFHISAKRKKTYSVKGRVVSPDHIFHLHKEEFLSIITKSLLYEDGFVSFNKEWFIRELLPRIRSDEIKKCYDYLKRTGTPLMARQLLKIVFNITPVAKKRNIFDVFRFTLDYRLEREPNFVNRQSDQGIRWDIKRIVPPRLIINTLTADSVSSGYLKITKGLTDLLAFCDIKDEIAFNSYGQYEIEAHVDLPMKRIWGDPLKHWFVENSLDQGDVVYIKSPTSQGQLPILYTAFEKRDSEETSGDKKREGTNRVYLRHHIYSLLVSERQYLHVKEIHQKIELSSKENINVTSISGILSRNTHVFTHFPGSRSLWGLTEWGTERPDIDSTSLSLVIEDESWVIRVLEEEKNPLTTNEIADRISSAFIIPRERILEITFLNPNDKRLIKFDTKWGLRVWVSEWKQRVEEIECYFKEYNELSTTKSKLKDNHKNLLTDLEKLQGNKVLTQTRLTELENFLKLGNENKGSYQQELEKLGNKLKLISVEKKYNKNISPILICLLGITLLGSVLLILIQESYKIPGIIICVLCLLLLSYFVTKMIQINKKKNEVLKNISLVEDTVQKLTTKLKRLTAKCLISEDERKTNQSKLETLDETNKEIISTLKMTEKKIEEVSKRMMSYDLNILEKEKNRLTTVINQCSQ